MLSSVLNSERAIQVNVLIIRAFIRMREMLAIKRIEELDVGQNAMLRRSISLRK